MSSFAQLDDDTFARGADRLRADLESGAWDARYGRLRSMHEIDLGYRIVSGRTAGPEVGSPAVLRLVLPKGSLERATLQLFDDADLRVNRASDVDYKASIDDPRVREVRILRPQEIPAYVEQGMFDLGITARDWIEETESDVVSLSQLRYSKVSAQPTRIVVAVAADSPWTSAADLPNGVRVHTEYRAPHQAVLRRARRRRRRHAVVRRHRGEDPRDRRRHRRAHRDRPGAPRRGLEGARHDRGVVHGADREPGRLRRSRQAQGDGAVAGAALGRARGPRAACS